MRLRLTKSRSSDVPLFSIDPRSGLTKHAFEHSTKISVVTDAADFRSIPREIRAFVRDERRIIRDFQEWSKSRTDSGACILWFAGDRFLEGDARDLLKSLRSQNRRSFIVVNTPCLEEVPFVTVQARTFVKPASVDHRSYQVRIESAATSATRMMWNSSRPIEPWARLVDAISSEKAGPGSGIELLVGLWESRDKVPGVIAALVLRNLVVAMLRHQEIANARRFLEAGAKLFPTYAEVHYLAAMLAVREHRFADAFPLLERAKSCGVSFPGSGGENSYRCDWLLGMLAARVGNDRVAFQHFLSGVKHTPLFEPSLTEMLKLGLPPALIERHQYDFTQAARGSPQLATRIFEYLSIHRAFDAARRVAQIAQLDPAHRESVGKQPANSTALLRTGVRPSGDQTGRGDSKQIAGITFEGPFFEYSSLARVNREIAHALLSSDEFEVRLETSSPGMRPPHLFPGGKTLVPSINKRLPHTELTIRHHWPPNFRRPPTGKLAVILPWEYGGVPRVWIDQIRQNVDELWVPSNFVREVLVRNGVDAERVVVIPNGYDPRIFNTDGPSLRPQGCREFIFLFVGGAIRRKGIDLLLQAYKAAFSLNQSITLILVVSGSSGAYESCSWVAEIRTAAEDPTYPHLLPILDAVDDAALSSMYRGCDAFVLPYRGEGFGMPLLEAMACGKTVIATADGPAKDFCDESNAYLIPASTEMVADTPPPLGPMVGDFTWFEPNFTELVQTLRHVHADRREAVTKGLAAARSVRHLTWDRVTGQYAGRIRRLCGL